MAIEALPNLIQAAAPFAACRIMVMEADPEDSLISHEEDVHVPVADAHRMIAAIERAVVLPERRLAKPRHKARGYAEAVRRTSGFRNSHRVGPPCPTPDGRRSLQPA